MSDSDLPNSRLWYTSIQKYGKPTVEAKKAIGFNGFFNAISDTGILFGTT